jgi:hypothetical protein
LPEILDKGKSNGLSKHTILQQNGINYSGKEIYGTCPLECSSVQLYFPLIWTGETVFATVALRMGERREEERERERERWRKHKMALKVCISSYQAILRFEDFSHFLFSDAHISLSLSLFPAHTP